uniref:ABC transporter domain-containing protein n=1 Tax=Strigamia maritima TaxID=126957 RepID=T1JC73_STRMM
MGRSMFWYQLKATVERNILIKKRLKTYLFAEIFLPIYFIVILALIRYAIPETVVNAILTPQGEATLLSRTISFPPQLPIAVAPDTVEVESLMKRVQVMAAQEGISLLFNYFDTEKDLIDANHNHSTTFTVAISFTNITNHSYSLYFSNGALPDFSTLFAVPRDCRQNVFTSADCPANRYFISGFAQLQMLIDSALIRMYTQKDYYKPDVHLMLFPKGRYVASTEYLRSFVPLYVVLSFSSYVTYVVILIVGEKEKKIRETMKMMGLKDSVYWMSWLVVYSMFLLFVCSIMSILMYYTKVLAKANIFLIFCSLFLYGLSVVTMSYMVTPFFNKAKVAGTIVSIINILFSCFYYLSVYVRGINPAIFWASCLLSPTALSLGIDTALVMDLIGDGLEFSNIWEGNFPFAGALIMLAIDTILYGFLAYYFDSVIPSEYGRKRSLFFCFQKSFWCPKKLPTDEDDVQSNTGSTAPLQNHNADIEPVPEEIHSKKAIKIMGLRKVFSQKGKEDLVAVNDVDLEIYEGQITALLGHNSAGKTTLLNILMGLTPQTAGTATVFGLNINDYNDLMQIRQMIGICPQHDVLFDRLTPREHLTFYAKIKNVSADVLKDKVDSTIKDVNLEDRGDAPSKNLSGGQKRKLSVGIALIGNPKIIILDEPTSGVDPYARRHLWSLLQSQKQGRLILLTTHFMDEADILADRKAILTKGRLRCVGSSLFLKNRFGLGYHLMLAGKFEFSGTLVGFTIIRHAVLSEGIRMVVEDNYNLNRIIQLVIFHIPNASQTPTHGREISFLLPLNQIEKFPVLFRALDEAMKQDGPNSLGVRSYGINMTTMEEVFLKLGEEGGEHILESKESAVKVMLLNRSLSHQESIRSSPPNTPVVENRLNLTPDDAGLDRVLEYIGKTSYSSWQSLGSIIWIRFLSNVRLPKNIYATIVMPVIMLIISFLFLRNQTTPELQTMLEIKPDMYQTLLGNPSLLYDNFTGGSLSKLLNAFQVQGVSSEAYGRTFRSLLNNPPHNYYLNITQYNYAQGLLELDAIYNDTSQHIIPSLINLLSNAWLGMASNSHTKNPITVHAKLLPNRKTSHSFDGNIFGSSTMIGFLFASIPLTLVVDVVEDRERKVKHLLRVNGMTFHVYWISFFVCHIFLMAISLIQMIIVVIAFGIQSLMTDGALLCLIIIYTLVLPSSLFYYYALSFTFKDHEKAQSFLSIFVVFVGYIPYVAVFVLDILSHDATSSWALHVTFSLLFPLYIPFSSLYYINKVYLMCQAYRREPTMADYFDKEILVIIFSLVLHVFVYYCVVRMLDLWSMGVPISSLFSKKDPAFKNNDEIVEGEDSEVIAERQKVDLLDSNPDTIANVLIKNLRKVYDPQTWKIGFLQKLFHRKPDIYANVPKVAVHNLSFTVGPGEVFGLLGPNGAGKTTTLRIVVSDEEPTAGKVVVAGYTVSSNLSTVFRLMGYCPQHDALWKNITLKEHLRCYARIRGIPEADVETVVNKFIEGLNIREHVDKKASQLSGGTQRKLSFAISLLGSSRIVLLDEPSTGMDPHAKRFLWNTIMASFRGTRGAILTTHSMEEAEIVCTRIGIMVKGGLRCLGSTQHLKNKYGRGYLLEIKLGPRTLLRDFQQFIKDLFPQAIMQESFANHFKYSIPQSTVSSLAEVFSNLEAAKLNLGISEYSFSQSTLEQVFLDFARQQEDEDQ